MVTFSIYFAKDANLLELRAYFETYAKSRTCRKVDELAIFDDVLELKPRQDAISFDLKYAAEKETTALFKTQDGTYFETSVVDVTFKTGHATIRRHSDRLLILVQTGGGSVEVLNLISYALRTYDAKPIPTEMSAECLDRLLERQKNIVAAKVEKNTRVSSITLDGELVNLNPDGSMNECPEYKDEDGEKLRVRYVTFDKMTVTLYRQNPVKVACPRKSAAETEEYVVKEVVPFLTSAYTDT